MDLTKLPKRIGGALLATYRRYPARCNALIAAAIVAGLGAIGVTVDVANVKEIVGIELPILLAGEATHHSVTPTRRK